MTVTLPCPTSARWSDPEPTGLPGSVRAVTMPDRLDRRALAPSVSGYQPGCGNHLINGGGTAPRVEIIESSGVFDEGCRPSTPRPAGAAGRDDRTPPQRTEWFGRGPERFRGEPSCTSPSTPHDHHHAGQASRRGRPRAAAAPPFLHDPAASLPATFHRPGTTRKDPIMSHSRLSATVRVATVTTPPRTSTPGRPFVPYNRLPVRRWW